MSFEQNIATCSRCPRKVWAEANVIRCSVDGRSMVDHAESRDCPEDRYNNTPTLLQNLMHGAAGIAKAVTGTGGASDDLVVKRTTICGGCEHAELGVLGFIDRCRLCGCSTWAKIRNETEKCPAGKW